jgi:hypothetical protein
MPEQTPDGPLPAQVGVADRNDPITEMIAKAQLSSDRQWQAQSQRSMERAPR